MPAPKHRKCCILNGADREKGRGAMDWWLYLASLAGEECRGRYNSSGGGR